MDIVDLLIQQIKDNGDDIKINVSTDGFIEVEIYHYDMLGWQHTVARSNTQFKRLSESILVAINDYDYTFDD